LVEIGLAGAKDEESLKSSKSALKSDEYLDDGDDGTYTVDGDSTKDRGGDSSAILGVFFRAHQGVVVCLEESTNDGEDDNGKDGDDDAVGKLVRR
jgi:hypothetical protein